MKIVLYLHLHQPWRLARYRYVDVGSGQTYVDRERNFAIFRRIAEQSYRPAFLRLRRMLEEDPGFRFSLSITGPWIEQAREAAPDLLPALAGMVRTGRVAIVGETYYHSLAFLLPPPELADEVAKHRAVVREEFGATPRVLRMTELAYSDELGKFAAEHQFTGMLAEGWEGTLQGRSPTRCTRRPRRRPSRSCCATTGSATTSVSASPPGSGTSTRSRPRSTSAGSPASRATSSICSSTSRRSASTTPRPRGSWTSSRRSLARSRPVPHLGWATVEEAIGLPKFGELSVPRTTTWADRNRDLGAWLGNDLQRSAFETAKSVGELVRRSRDPDLLDIWRQLLTSDHFYYMYLGGHGADLGVHQYLSAYGSPYDAYATYMNALTDLRQRALRAPAAGEKVSTA